MCVTIVNMELNVGQVTMEKGDLSRRQSEFIKVTAKQFVWNWMESVAKIEIYCINLTLGMNQMRNE